MTACYEPTHPMMPENPAKVQGPELGFAVYTYKDRPPEVVRVIERSYVWSPEQHHEMGHGYRRYDWKVIERGPNRFRSVVVDDADLSPLPEGFVVTYSLRARRP
jgi:hypothetical protein